MTVDDWAAGATIGGQPMTGTPDLVRMRRERYGRIQRQLEAEGLDGLVLLGTSTNAYAAGALAPGDDSGRASLFRPVTVVAKGAEAPHLYTPYWDGAPADLPADHIHGPLFPDLADGIDKMGSALSEHFAAGARLGVDEQTHPMMAALGSFEWSDANNVLGPCKLLKTPDEVACIRIAQRINELAMVAAQAILRPGVRQSELSGAFLRRIFELGATTGSIDPIWQVMERTRAEGPWTLHGDLAYPTSTTDRFLREGDVIWVDAGITYEGYSSDYGRTWITSAHPEPSTRQAAQFTRWRGVIEAVLDICKPGVTAHQLARAAIAANDGVRPWMQHFYLAHGVGTDSAEMPLIGTDLGEAFDEQVVMEPGMVLVLEPIIWDDGAAGYRSEDIVAVTDDGWVQLSGNRYEPFSVAA
jgi:Xaa-Pro aminopeptidase